MNCPVCKNAMIVLELREVEIDFCAACRGIWLDAGELETLLADHEKAQTLLDSFAVDEKSEEAKRKCPICSGKMQKVLVGDSHLLLDKCPKDHGLWFDAGELHEIVDHAKLDSENKIKDLLNDMFSAGQKKQMKITKENFGTTDSGQAADIYTLTNDNGIEVKITNYGGIVTSLITPDKDGQKQDVALGYETLEQYLADTPYFGALIGRFGNRIAKGKFTLNGKEYTLARNNGENHLHGGIKGFDKVLWQATPIESEDSVALKLKYLSKDGQEGYPGNLECTVTYSLTNDNELRIDYKAVTDAPTIVNLTHHSYFNLAGHGSGDCLEHKIMINADSYSPVNDALIPTGKIESVEGTPMDFRHPHTIGERIDQVPGGYDHNYVLNKTGSKLELAARVTEPASGRIMEVFTTEPGMQFYSGNFLDDSLKGKGATYQKHAGFCLETQHFPDSPNQPNFPSVVLNPGQMYRHLTVYKFSTK